MPKFAVKKIEEIVGKVSFYKLEVEGKCPFDEFWEEIEKDGNMAKELYAIQARMGQIANMAHLPGDKYHKLEGTKDDWTEYEIKTKNLRVYLFQEEGTGKIIVSGGKKKDQASDIEQFRNLKSAYKKNKNKT